MLPIKFSKIRSIKLWKHSCRIDHSVLVKEELSRRSQINVMTTISGFVSIRIGGPQVPAPLEV